MKRIEMPGIRLKVMAYLILFVGFVVGMLWISQVLFLGEFYTYFKTRQAANAADTVIRRLSEGSDAVEDVAVTNEVNITILNDAGEVVYSGEGTGFGYLRNMPAWEVQSLAEKAPENGAALVQVVDGKDVPLRRGEPRSISRDQKVMYYIRRIPAIDEEGDMVLLLAALLTPVEATVSVIRAQLVIITLLIGFGANLLALLISARVTRPIIRTNAAAKALSHGDFTPPEKCGYREIAELNETLSQASKELKQVERLQRELIANISHDLRTPLTMIGGYAEVMRDIPGEMQPENMQVIIDETHRLTTLVNNLLDLSRIQSGAVKMAIAPFNVTKLLQVMAHRYTLMMEREGYRIELDAPESLVVLGEYVRIEQVIHNLISNALTYTGADKTVRVTQEKRGDMVRISVHDSGAGIDPAELPFIWQRYYRTSGAHRRSVQGAGIGLSIVASILQEHNAPYGADSTPGAGSVFWFELKMGEGKRETKPTN